MTEHDIQDDQALGEEFDHDAWMKLGDETNSTSYAPRMIMERGEGMYLFDTEGKRYLDFLAGIAVNSLGNCPPRIVAALREQAGRMLQISNMFYSRPQIELQRRVTELSFGDRVYLCNSGTEANEAAFKLARRYQRVTRGDEGRTEIISFKKSFHGRTLASVTATGQPKYHKGFEPLVPGFRYATFNDLESVRELIGPQTTAVIVEPIQGEGGIRPATQEFLEGLRELCDEHEALLIFDEVQCGVGRTGKPFAYQYFGVEPDIMSLAKGFGGGVPIGAMVATDEVFAGFQVGSHASTYGGNPLMCVAANIVLDEIAKPEFLEQVTRVGAYMLESLRGAELPITPLEIRGVGLMIGVEVESKELAVSIVKEARARGLVMNTAGGNTLRFVPPLIAEEAHVDEAVRILAEAMGAVSASE